MNVGIVGQGFVGSAIREGLKDFHKVRTYDIKSELGNCNNINELIEASKIIFVCVPTPMRKDGSCDTRIISKAVKDIDVVASQLGDKKVLIVKSTVPPGTTHKLSSECSSVDILFSPQFLTEANSFEDFKNQTRTILGGREESALIVEQMFREVFPEIPIVKTDTKTAETIKYFTNCFLSTKVSFANEFKQVCDSLEVQYDEVIEYALHDKRLGRSHWSVPGPDGDYGFGGHCFPKDLKAMLSIANDFGIQTTMLQATWDKNNEVRSDKDWEKMSGRAVSDD